MKITLRELRDSDVETIVEITLAAWTPIYGCRRELMGPNLFSALYPDWQQSKAEEIRRSCRPETPIQIRVAELDNQIVGFLSFATDDQTGVGTILNNAVHPDFQGRGIGKQMYEFAFEKFREMSMRFVKVHTGCDPAHAAARRAYEKMGFDIQLQSIDFYREL